ncbi:hypothetical protein [Marinobacterium mangrovicola]|uniref:Uncharacterized protein n=1 Tax=Marinobacterium mangrovicola TaxID=1476959 RepID=A0A4R1GN97_9GAMM|nr:hypothetical protein [Marinobacterium mangrovicola]TCK08670.1 hypothetical protein CLV83_0762 [Marinobacterium mangrovicola]
MDINHLDLFKKHYRHSSHSGQRLETGFALRTKGQVKIGSDYVEICCSLDDGFFKFSISDDGYTLSLSNAHKTISKGPGLVRFIERLYGIGDKFKKLYGDITDHDSVALEWVWINLPDCKLGLYLYKGTFGLDIRYEGYPRRKMELGAFTLENIELFDQQVKHEMDAFIKAYVRAIGLTESLPADETTEKSDAPTEPARPLVSGIALLSTGVVVALIISATLFYLFR